MAITVKSCTAPSVETMCEKLRDFRYKSYREGSTLDIKTLVRFILKNFIVVDFDPYAYDVKKIVCSNEDDIFNRATELELYDPDYPEDGRMGDTDVSRATDDFYRGLEDHLNAYLDECLEERA